MRGGATDGAKKRSTIIVLPQPVPPCMYTPGVRGRVGVRVRARVRARVRVRTRARARASLGKVLARVSLR